MMSLHQDWNFVKNAMRTPCHNGGMNLYIETGAAAAGLALLDIVTFGCREPLKWSTGRGQIKNIFGTRNRGTNNPLTHRKPRVGGSFRSPNVKAGTSFFWAFQGMLERTLYYWMLADVTKDFFLNWTSMLMAANGCGGPYAGYCQWNIQPQVVGGNPTELLIGALPGCHGVLSDIRHIYIPMGLTASVSYHASAVPWAPAQQPGSTLQTRLEDIDAGLAWAASEQGSPASGDNGVVGFERNLPARTAGYRKLSVVGRSSGFSYITSGTIEVTLSGTEVPIFDPPNCFKNATDKAAAAWMNAYKDLLSY